MALSRENRSRRREIRRLVERAEIHGHISSFPIKVVFKPSPAMDYDWAYALLKGSGKNRYFEIAFDERYMNTSHGRDLCVALTIHELAHVFTWSGNEKVEDAKTAKYGDHGPDFGVVYARLWTDLMENYDLEDGDDDNED